MADLLCFLVVQPKALVGCHELYGKIRATQTVTPAFASAHEGAS